MEKERVWLVISSSGLYEDYHENVIGVHKGKEEAVAQMKESNKIFKELEEFKNSEIDLDEMENWNTDGNDEVGFYGSRDKSPYSKKEWKDFDRYNALIEEIIYNDRHFTSIRGYEFGKGFECYQEVTQSSNGEIITEINR